MSTYRVIVCGGRNYADVEVVRKAIAQLPENTLLIHGGCSGADTLAELCAHARGLPVKVYPARWKDHGRAAGPIRNQEMLDNEKPHLLLVFPGGRGTVDMKTRAVKAGIEVLEV